MNPVKFKQIPFSLCPKGAGLNAIAGKLEDEKVIDNRYVFRFGAYATDLNGGLKRGEYLLPADASMRKILDTLIEGRPIQYSVTIPEGSLLGRW